MPKLVDHYGHLPPLRRQKSLMSILLCDRSVSSASKIQQIILNDIPAPSPHTPRELIVKMNRQADYTAGHWPPTAANWQAYVSELKIEICCGEAPFIVERGKNPAPVPERCGFLDRKLQVVSYFCQERDQWFQHAVSAYQSSYGYEISGSRLLTARENLLYTFVDFWNHQFPEDTIDLRRKLSPAHQSILTEVATIISWNLFQMDGGTYLVPFRSHNVYAKIMDWQSGEVLRFADL